MRLISMQPSNSFYPEPEATCVITGREMRVPYYSRIPGKHNDSLHNERQLTLTFAQSATTATRPEFDNDFQKNEDF